MVDNNNKDIILKGKTDFEKRHSNQTDYFNSNIRDQKNLIISLKF